MCSIIPEAWNIHTFIAMFQHELIVHGVSMSGTSLCFIYILPSASPNGILFIKQYFQKEKNKQFATCIV